LAIGQADTCFLMATYLLTQASAQLLVELLP
jgi:hypothetical protein